MSVCVCLQARVSESRREEVRLREKLSEAERDLGEAERCLLTSQQERDETAAELKVRLTHCHWSCV